MLGKDRQSSAKVTAMIGKFDGKDLEVCRRRGAARALRVTPLKSVALQGP